jgi:hypothetical protein
MSHRWGLDPEHRDRAWRLLDTERSERGGDDLFSTHYLAEAESCDHLVLLAGGRVVGAGTPAALKAVVGDQVIEVEDSDAVRLLPALHVSSPSGRRSGPSAATESAVTAGQLLAAFITLVVGAVVSSVLGLLVAAPLRSVENFAGVINMALFPLLFLSGALYPTAGMPR